MIVAIVVGPAIKDVVVVPVLDVVPHGLIASGATLCCLGPMRSCGHDSSLLLSSGVRSPTGPAEQHNRWSTAFCAALAARHSTLESACNWRAQLALCGTPHKAKYVDGGVMWTPVIGPGSWPSWRLLSPHNHRASRKARRASDGL